MATFPSIQPTYGTRKQSNPKFKTTQMGDGYEFRTLFGLPSNQDPKIYDLTFNVSETEADVIEAFLRSRVADQASFTFTPPEEGSTQTGTYSQSGGTTVTITSCNGSRSKYIYSYIVILNHSIRQRNCYFFRCWKICLRTME